MVIPVSRVAENRQSELLVEEYKSRRETMAVEQVGEKYRCNVCGNEVTVTKAGGGTLVCCEQEMEKIE